MIKRWEIAKVEDSKNRNKHRLLLMCELKDILKIVKVLGSICSRPERIISNDYNFLLYLFDYNEDVEDKLKKIIGEVSKKNTEDIKPSSVVKDNNLNNLKPQVEPNPDISIPMPDLEIKKEEVKQKEPQPVDEVKTEQKDTSNRFKFGPAIPKSQSVRIVPDAQREKKEEDKKSAEKEKTVDARISKRTAEKLKLKWSIELPLNPTLSFQTLITGSHNRFAHAAAMAVVENPGVMYNPILIYGPVGNGKSHFIHSMSYGLSSSMGQKNIFVTNGVKFSIGVNLAIKDGFVDRLERIINDCKVIIIDDIHLMLVNKDNKSFISKILNQAMQSNKQVVFSSLFSPEELEPLESMLGIQFSQGWMVDIKQPNPQTYRLILNQLLGNMDIKLSEDEIKKFFVSKNLDFRSINKMLSRTKKIEKYILSSNPSLMHRDMLDMLFGDSDDLSLPSDSEIKGANLYPESSDDSYYRWGFFYPSNMKDYINYVSSKIKEVASKGLSVDISWKNVFFEEYNPDEVYGIPFKIGNFVLDKNINGLVVLGPTSTSALSAKEDEFKHLTEKIMESLNIKTGWIYSNRLKANSVYLNAILDLV